MESVIAWAAGFVDGDGSIHVCRVKPRGSNKSPQHILQVSAANTDRAPLEILVEGWRGTISSFAAHGWGEKLNYIWCLNSRGALAFLRDVLPHLRTYKQLQAKFAIQFQEGKSKDHGRNSPLSEADLNWREMHRELIRLVREKVGGGDA